MTVKTFKPASPAQLKFVRSLSEDREVPIAGKDEGEAFVIARWEDCFSGKDVEMKEASQVIDWLKTLPRKAKEVKSDTGTPAALTEGIYISPVGDIIKLKKSKAGHLYAQVAMAISGERLTFSGNVVNFEYVYTPGLTAHLTPAMRMSEAQAQDFALRSGRCAWCRRAIKTSSSLLAGVGPVCAKKFS